MYEPIKRLPNFDDDIKVYGGILYDISVFQPDLCEDLKKEKLRIKEQIKNDLMKRFNMLKDKYPDRKNDIDNRLNEALSKLEDDFKDEMMKDDNEYNPFEDYYNPADAMRKSLDARKNDE